MSFTIRRSLAERFWEKVDKRDLDECWPWTACINGLGYGSLFKEKVGGKAKTTLAHRVSYELAQGPIPRGLLVLHTCDNPPCVNPAHLWLGTDAENSADREQKKRGRQPKGSRSGNAKLTEDDVVEIRMIYPAQTQDELAALYGVHQGTISKILLGKSWVHAKADESAEGLAA